MGLPIVFVQGQLSLIQTNLLIPFDKQRKEKVTKFTRQEVVYTNIHITIQGSVVACDQLQFTHTTDRRPPLRTYRPPVMRDATPPITTTDTMTRSTQQYELHSVWDQECAGMAKRVAKTDTAKNVTKIERSRST